MGVPAPVSHYNQLSLLGVC